MSKRNKERYLIDKLFHNPNYYLLPVPTIWSEKHISHYSIFVGAEAANREQLDSAFIRFLLKNGNIASFDLSDKVCFYLSKKAIKNAKRRHEKSNCKDCKINKILESLR